MHEAPYERQSSSKYRLSNYTQYAIIIGLELRTFPRTQRFQERFWDKTNFGERFWERFQERLWGFNVSRNVTKEIQECSWERFQERSWQRFQERSWERFQEQTSENASENYPR